MGFYYKNLYFMPFNVSTINCVQYIKYCLVILRCSMLLKRKVYLSLILAVAAPLAISTLIFSNSIRSNTEEKLAKVDLPTALSEVKSQIELELSTPIVVGKEIAQNLFVQQWMNNNEDAQSRGKFIDYLKHIKD